MLFPVYSQYIPIEMPFFARGFPRIFRDSPGFAVAQGKRLGTLRVASTAGRRLIEVPANGPGRKTRKTWISRPVVQHGELNIKKTIQNSSKHGDFTFVKNDFNDFFQKDGGYEQSDVIGDICIIGNWYHPTMRVCPKIGYPKKYSATLRDQQDNASNISHKKQSKKRFRPYISTHTENSSIHFLKPTDVRPSRALSASLNLRKA